MSNKILPNEIDCGYDGTDFEDVAYESIEAQSDKGVLFIVRGKEIWIPLSCIWGVDVDRVFVTSLFAKREELL